MEKEKKHTISIISSITLILALMWGIFSSFNYDSAWKEVDKNLRTYPKTALSKLEEIEEQAKKEKNRPQTLRCLMTKFRICDLKEDSAYVKCIEDLHDFQSDAKTDPLALSVSYYMESMVYASFYGMNSWKINQRTKLSDTIPADMEEWTSNIFVDRIRMLRDKAIDEPAVRTTASADYEAIIQLNKDSRIYRPTLFDLMVHHALDNNNISNELIYNEDECRQLLEKLIEFHINDKDKHAYTLACLEYYRQKGGKEYRENLESFLNRMDDNESSILVRIDLANLLYSLLPKKQSIRDLNTVQPSDILKICEDGLNKYPKHPQSQCLKNIEKNIRSERYSIDLANTTIHSGEPIKLNIHYANITQINMSLFKYDLTPQEWYNKPKDAKKVKIKEYDFILSPSNYCIEADTTIEIPSQAYGAYRIETAPNKYFDFVVSDLFVVYQNESSTDELNLVVVDSKCGEPMKNVQTDLYSYHYRTSKSQLGDLEQTNKSDSNGFCDFKLALAKNTQTPLRCILTNGEDKYTNLSTYTYRNRILAHDNAGDYLSIFTDRTIYRPGQTVYFKCIAYRLGVESIALADKKIKITLRDANYQEVASTQLTTNEFGSVSSSFVIPSAGLAGMYTIEADDNQVHFSVEEYKRPTFEISLTTPTEAISFGDTLLLKGKADYLLGTSVSAAKVAYKITRRENPHFWWWHNGVPDKIVADGTVQTDETGTFRIPFVPIKENNEKSCFLYNVEVTLTDEAGETQQDEMSFSVGDETIKILCPSAEKTKMNQVKNLRFSVVNLNYQGVEKEISYEIYRSADSVRVHTGKTTSNQEGVFTIPNPNGNWLSGNYEFKFKTVDDHQNEIEEAFRTILYKESEKKPPVQTSFWTEDIGNFEIDEKQTHKVRIGTSLHNAHLLVWSKNAKNEVSKEWIGLNDEIKEIDFKLNGTEALNVDFYLIHDFQAEHARLSLSETRPDKSLPMKLSVFRDKMQPGSKEKWTITVPKGREVELMAAMYDAALDEIKPHSWHFHPMYFKNFNFPLPQHLHPRTGQLASYSHNNGATGPIFSFDQWQEFFNRYHYGGRLYKTQMATAGMNQYVMMDMDDGAIAEEESVASPTMSMNKAAALGTMDMSRAADAVANDEGSEYDGSTNTSTHSTKPKIRENLNETAFFLPHLSADSNGNITLTFTMPESLTRWKLMAVGHTKDLYCGSLLQEVVTQKEFMVSPVLPRFLRHGDHCTFSAKIINLSENPQEGTAKIEFINPETGKVVASKISDFNLNANQNGTAEWTLDIPQGIDVVLIRTSATTPQYSDAEQKLLPILSDKVVLTQSMPMIIRGGKTKEYSFDNLVENKSNTLHSKFLKLEMASNPIWYAVHALPSAAMVEHENAVSYSAAHFAAQMAHQIVRSNPKLFSIIQLWKEQSKDKQTLLSNLMKNDEVKNILLDETPWVMDAKNETERKQRLATLFDVNDLESKTSLWSKKLCEYQTEEGGYAWFKGMNASRHTTLFVIDNFGRLKKNGIDVSNDLVAVEKAIHFLDDEIRKDLEWEKKHNKSYPKNILISSSQLYYFQVRSLFPEIKFEAGTKEAYRFYYDLMEKQWKDFSLYGKALAAIALHRGGDIATAKYIIRSLREHSTTNEDFGMYWQKNISGYSWQDAAISTHTRIMEALQIVDPQQEEQDELRIWLLNQKRTQNWDNVIATIDALNVLLQKDSDWLSKENKVNIQLGGEAIVPNDAEAGTGYFSATISGEKVTPRMGRIDLSSEEGGNMSWGAVYWQFEEELEKVVSDKTGLHIEKEMKLETIEKGQTVLTKIGDKTKLMVGDKLVVRLTLRTDRDLEYVSLKDQRASCTEPLQQLSGYRCSEHTCYYQSVKDAATYYFFDHLSKGTYVFEYRLWITNEGDFTNGITTVQCLYAPEFSSNTGSVRLHVGKQ